MSSDRNDYYAFNSGRLFLNKSQDELFTSMKCIDDYEFRDVIAGQPLDESFSTLGSQISPSSSKQSSPSQNGSEDLRVQALKLKDTLETMNASSSQNYNRQSPGAYALNEQKKRMNPESHQILKNELDSPVDWECPQYDHIFNHSPVRGRCSQGNQHSARTELCNHAQSFQRQNQFRRKLWPEIKYQEKDRLYLHQKESLDTEAKAEGKTSSFLPPLHKISHDRNNAHAHYDTAIPQLAPTHSKCSKMITDHENELMFPDSHLTATIEQKSSLSQYTNIATKSSSRIQYTNDHLFSNSPCDVDPSEPMTTHNTASMIGLLLPPEVDTSRTSADHIPNRSVFDLPRIDMSPKQNNVKGSNAIFFPHEEAQPTLQADHISDKVYPHINSGDALSQIFSYQNDQSLRNEQIRSQFTAPVRIRPFGVCEYPHRHHLSHEIPMCIEQRSSEEKTQVRYLTQDHFESMTEQQAPETMELQKHSNKAKKYFCETCQKLFSSLSGFDYHQKGHKGIAPYICHFCQKAFRSKASQKRHMKSHSGERPYSCSICEKLFSRPDHLKRHMKTHNPRPFSCSIEGCNRTYATSLALENHLQRHSRDD